MIEDILEMCDKSIARSNCLTKESSHIFNHEHEQGRYIQTINNLFITRPILIKIRILMYSIWIHTTWENLFKQDMICYKNPDTEGVYIRWMNTCAWLTGTWTQDNVYYFGEVCLINNNTSYTITKFTHVVLMLW